MRHHIGAAEVVAFEEERSAQFHCHGVGHAIAEIQLGWVFAGSTEGHERLRCDIGHGATKWNDRNTLYGDKILQPTRSMSRQIHCAPRASLDKRRRPNGTVLGDKKIEKLLRTFFAFDNRNKN